MNKQNRTEYRIVDRGIDVTGAPTPVSESMQYFIDYAAKMFYPNYVWIMTDRTGKLYVEAESQSALQSDIYHYYVVFDEKGKFVKGHSRFMHAGCRAEYVEDEFAFKQKLKREINKVNQIHATSKRLVEEMQGA